MADLGWLSLDSEGTKAWVEQMILSLILAFGMFWSHIRRRLVRNQSSISIDREGRWKITGSRLYLLMAGPFGGKKHAI